MNICKKLCNECPFSNKSIPGWLANYQSMDFKNMMDQEIMFPCHMTMSDGDLTIEKAQIQIQNGNLKLCRGYIESMIKSAKMPKYNKYLLEIRRKIKEEGVSENSMSINEFLNYHNQY